MHFHIFFTINLVTFYSNHCKIDVESCFTLHTFQSRVAGCPTFTALFPNNPEFSIPHFKIPFFYYGFLLFFISICVTYHFIELLSHDAPTNYHVEGGH